MKRILWLAMILGAAYGGHVIRGASVPPCADAEPGQHCVNP